MKKVVAVILVLISITSVAYADFYPRAGRIVEIDPVEDVVTFIDGAGLLWEFYGIEDYEVDDIVACIYWDADTPDSIFDDEIIAVEYAGIF